MSALRCTGKPHGTVLCQFLLAHMQCWPSVVILGQLACPERAVWNGCWMMCDGWKYFIVVFDLPAPAEQSRDWKVTATGAVVSTTILCVKEHGKDEGSGANAAPSGGGRGPCEMTSGRHRDK